MWPWPAAWSAGPPRRACVAPGGGLEPPTYDMERQWSGVAKRVRDRASGNLLAGDDAPYNQYNAALFQERFHPKIPIEGLSVLDVGCGPGAKLRWMTEQHPGRVVGCDQSSEMVNLAKRNAPEAEIIQIDGENLPFADKEFDVVTTTTVLQHNPDDRRAKLLGEICRVSAKDVFLFEDTPVEMPPPTTTAGPYRTSLVAQSAGMQGCAPATASSRSRLTGWRRS